MIPNLQKSCKLLAAFMKTKFYLFKYPFYKKKHIDKLLNQYDIILPKKENLKKILLEDYGDSHYKDDMIKIGEIIKNDWPEYSTAFDEAMKGYNTYSCNMFIAKKDVIDGYCQWLFDILFKLEKLIDISDRDSYQQRVFGFLSERLLIVYIYYHKELKVFETYIRMVNKNPIFDQFNRLKNRIKKLFKKK
jgi:hypothetical protein